MAKCRCQAKLLDDGACPFKCHLVPTTAQMRSAAARAREQQEKARIDAERLGTFKPEIAAALKRVGATMPRLDMYRPNRQQRAAMAQRKRSAR